MNLEAHIEAVLFWKGEPVRVKELARVLSVSEEEVKVACNSLGEKLSDRGLVLVVSEDSYELRTNPLASELIESLQKDDLNKDLGKAGLETLAIILYQGPISRAQIDFIRGVNSTFILRNLLVRGLIEKVSNPEDKRAFLYQITHDALGFLGIAKKEDMPEFVAVQTEIENFMQSKDEEPNEPQE